MAIDYLKLYELTKAEQLLKKHNLLDSTMINKINLEKNKEKNKEKDK